MNGLYRGIVIENDETKNPSYTGQLTGAIKVIVPEIHRLPSDLAVREKGDDPVKILRLLVESGQGFWASPCFPWGSSQTCDWYIPPKESGVWIAFEAGRAAFPVWLGVWRTPNKAPKKSRMPLPTGLDKDWKVYNSGFHLIEIKNKTGQAELHYKNLINNFEFTVDNTGALTVLCPKAANLTFQDTYTITIAKAYTENYNDAYNLNVTKATTFNLSDNFTVNLGSKKMVVNAAAAEVCGTNALALFTELKTLRDEFNSFISLTYNMHMHPTAAVGAPSVPTIVGTAPTVPVGTTKLKGA